MSEVSCVLRNRSEEGLRFPEPTRWRRRSDSTG